MDGVVCILVLVVICLRMNLAFALEAAVEDEPTVCWPSFGDHQQPVRETVSYRGLFTVDWFDVREKHCSRLEIYDRLRASEQAGSLQWFHIQFSTFPRVEF